MLKFFYMETQFIKGHKLIFKAIVGSQSYGTSTPESDIDYKGVYIQHNDDILSFGYVEQINVTKDETYYEVRRFLELIQSANPTVLELLYSPEDCILIMEPEFELIRQNRDKFLTKQCKNSFAGYAVAQIAKARGLNKKMNWEKERVERKTVFDFIYIEDNGKTIPIQKFLTDNAMDDDRCGLVALNHFKDAYALYYDPTENKSLKYRGLATNDSNTVRLSEVPKGEIRLGVVSFNKDGYSTHCRDYKEYMEWMNNRNTHRYVEIENHNQKIDGKNMMHCRRLIDTALEIATLKTINVRRPNKDYLLDIRKGKLDLDHLLKTAEEDILKINQIFDECDLPKDTDRKFINDLLIQIRKM